MKKALLIASVLFIAVISTACINNIAVQELNNKASEFMQKGDYESAINRLQASIDLDSSLYETYYNLGIASTNAKKYDLAIEAFENGIKLKPEYANFYYSLAIVQAEYYESILENEDDIEKVISNEEKAKLEDLKNLAIQNAEKYIELAPKAEDIEDVKELIINLRKPNTKEEMKVLEG